MGKKKIERKYDQLMKTMIPEIVTSFNQRTVRTAGYHEDEDVENDAIDNRLYAYDAFRDNYISTWIDFIPSMFARNKITSHLSHLTVPSTREHAIIYYDPDEYTAKQLIEFIITDNYRDPSSIIFTNEFKMISSLIEDTGIYDRHYLNTRSILINSDIEMDRVFVKFKTILTIHVIDIMCWLITNAAIRYVQKTDPNYPINILIIDRMMQDRESVTYLCGIVNQLLEQKGYVGFPIDLRNVINESNMTIGSHLNDLVYYKDGSIETGVMVVNVREINGYGTHEYSYSYELANMQKGIMNNTLKDAIIKQGKEMAFLTHYSNYIDRVLRSTISSLNR